MESKAHEKLGIKRAELDEAERRLSVHREALEAEMAEALARVSESFKDDITHIQRTAAMVIPLHFPPSSRLSRSRSSSFATPFPSC